MDKSDHSFDHGDDEEDESNNSDDFLEELEEEMLDIQCIFCSFHSINHQSMFDHIKQEHSIDFVPMLVKQKFDTFQFIKLVNYVRKNQVQPACFNDVALNKSLFDVEEYFKPTLENDHFLMFDLENETNDSDQANPMLLDEIQEIGQDPKEYLKKCSKEELIDLIVTLRNQINESNERLSEIRHFFLDEDKEFHQNNIRTTVLNASNLNESSDRGYIDSYSHFSIHHTMLTDYARTVAYQQAINNNRIEMFERKSVLDIGCGTGILSLFAAQAGASIVVGVEHSEMMALKAMAIVHENNLDQTIKIVKGKLEDICFEKLNLPSQYDVIVSEWMGYFLLSEGMLDTVLHAAKKYLKPSGFLLPNHCQMFLAAFSDQTFYDKMINFWHNVYGFRMSSMIDDVCCEALIQSMESKNVCSSHQIIHQFEVSQLVNKENNEQPIQMEDGDYKKIFSSQFRLKFNEDCLVHGLVGWFDCHFDSSTKNHAPIVLSTSPDAEPTHWKQTLFPWREPLPVKRDSELSGQMLIQRNLQNVRSLIVHFRYENHTELKSCKYFLDGC